MCSSDLLDLFPVSGHAYRHKERVGQLEVGSVCRRVHHHAGVGSSVLSIQDRQSVYLGLKNEHTRYHSIYNSVSLRSLRRETPSRFLPF